MHKQQHVSDWSNRHASVTGPNQPGSSVGLSRIVELTPLRKYAGPDSFPGPDCASFGYGDSRFH